MVPLFEQTLITHTKDYLCAISKNSVEQFWRRRFLNVCTTFAMFTLSFAIISQIIQVVPSFEQTLITHTQGLFVCNIREFC